MAQRYDTPPTAPAAAPQSSSSPSIHEAAQQDREQLSQQQASSSVSSSSGYSPSTTSSRVLALPAASPAGARRHPSTSSSLSNVTNYAGDDNDDEEDRSVRNDTEAIDAVQHATRSNRQVTTSPPTRPVNTFTRAGSGLPLAPASMHDEDQHERGDSPGTLYQQPSVSDRASGITQQRVAAAAAAAAAAASSELETSTSDGIGTPYSTMAFSNITHRRAHAPSLGAYSQSSASSFGSSSSSPPTSHFSSNPPGSTRPGNGALSEGNLSPPTSIGTGVGGSNTPAGQHSRQHSQQSPTLPIAISSTGQLANIGIGISTPQPTGPASIPTSTLSTQTTTTCPSASPAPVGPASLPPLSSLPAPSPTGATSVTTRLNTTPFLPSPLAQASLAPGEEEGEHIEIFGLDAAMTADEKKATSPAWSGNMAFPTRDRTGRTSDASASSLTSASPSVLRRSTSVSQAVGYKAASNRRRISSISQQQTHKPNTSQSTTISPPPPSAALSPPASVGSFATPAAVAAAAAAQRPGSPSPLRKEASLLSMSRDAVPTTTPSSVPSRTTGGNDRSGSNSDTSSSNSGGLAHSPTPRPVKYQSIAIPTPSASGRSVGSTSSPSASASSSGDSPLDFRFPPPHQSISASPGATSAFRARQMSVSSSGSAASANSAPARAMGGLHHSPTAATKSLSPPHLSSSLAMSASSPGLSYHVPSGSHRSNSISIHNRGTHGRSESLSSVLGSSTAMASSPSSTSSAALSTSPSASFRPFPSAPPVATPSGLSGSFSFLPASSITNNVISSPDSHHPAQQGLSPSSSFSSPAAGRGDATTAQASTSVGAGGIRLQRVPTSVRLAQELHPMSPVVEKRRLSIDPSSTSSSAMVASTSFLSAFKIAGTEDTTSSNSSGSETEYRTGGTGTHLGLRLPATPMATRRNTPSPSGVEEDAERTLQAQDPDGTQSANSSSTQYNAGLASPFNVYAASQAPRQRSPSGSPSNTSPSHSTRSLSIATPPLQSTSAYAPLFPFSVPRSAARGSFSTSLAASGAASSPPTLSRSHSRSRSKGQASPVINRLSPRMSTDPFGIDAISSPSIHQSHLVDAAISPRTAVFPHDSSHTSSSSGSGSLAKRNTISGLAPSMSSSSLFEPATTLADSPVVGNLSPPSKSPRVSGAGDRLTSPTSIKKQFRTSMMPGSISTSSTEDYARHLQESRASKLRKWATGTNQADDFKLDTGLAGNTIGAGSDIQAAGTKARRRAAIPDFTDFNYSGDRAGKDYRDELAGDLGARPGTAGSREIEWVDWLDEYKKMKEAKIRAEQEQYRQSILADLDEGAEAEGDDIALEMDPAASLHGRKRSDDLSSQDPLSRRGSGGDKSDTKMPFPGAHDSEESPELGSAASHRPRRLSTASLASLSLIDPSKRKRASQDSLAGAPRPAIPAAIVPRKPLGGRSVSYAPPTAYSAMRQEEAPQGPAAAVQPKKRKNIASKIDAWWSAVTKSFGSASDDKKSPPPPPPPMSIPAPSARQSQTQLPPLPQLPPLTTDYLMPAVSIDPADLPGRVSAHYSRQGTSLPVPPNVLRHTASASDLTPEKKVYGGGQLPMGALAPAARVPTYFEPHQRLNSAGSEGDGSSGSGGAGKADFKRRNPQLSLRLDPRFQPAGTAHRLGDRPLLSRNSSTSLSSSSGPPSQLSQTVFKEPRPPAPRQAEQTPSLTPGQSPIWDRTPGLVPLSQGQDVHLVRSVSKTSSLQKTPATTPAAPLPPSFSMSHIREHIKHRLTGAKHNCDKELKKIVTGITVYVEKELEDERAFASGLVSRQEEEPVILEDHAYSESPAPGLLLEENDAGNEAEDEYDVSSNRNVRPGLHHMNTGSSTSTDPPRSVVGSPSMSFSQPSHSAIPKAGPPARRGRTSGHASPRRAAMPSKRHPLGAPVRPADLAARLEQSLTLENTENAVITSNTTSRSASRSRSPMPHHHSGSAVNRTSSAEWFKQHDAPENDDKRHFLHSLQEIVTIAMEIQDTSVTDLTDDPSACAQLIRRVQRVGQRWDDHPNWPLRGWYVQLLLAVAGLSRVAEFWAEERGFWNFEDQKDAHENDPILFVAKAPAPEEEPSLPSRSRSRATSSVLGLGRAPSQQEQVLHTPSPLGVDLGVHRVEEEASADTSITVSAPPALAEEASRAEEAEVLREAVEEVRSVTILMELALDGVSFQYLSPVWEDVVGLPPNVCLGRPISHLLHPDDAAVFAEASKHLQEDDSHTIEAQFRLRVFGENEDPDDHTAESFEAMEGKGMLIRDRMHGAPSHTMWVIRPVPSNDAPSDDGEATTVRPPTASYLKAFGEPITPFATAQTGRLPVEPLLCRICDRQIPTWFFEKHSETCNETHRLEVDIGETNDKLSELRTVANGILEALKTSVISDEPLPPPEYQDAALLPSRYRDSQVHFLEEILEALGVALQISTPTLADDQLPVESQRLLSPTSEDHLSFLQKWQAPTSEDPALRRLAEDMSELCRQKTTVVNRLRNTIIYVERVRLEWELQAQNVLAAEPWEGRSQSPPPSPAPTILPPKGDSTLSTMHDGTDLYEHPTPVLPKSKTFLAQASTVPVQQIPDRESPVSFENVSPAALLQPLPMIDPTTRTPRSNAPSSQSLTLSPSLIPTSPRLSSAAPARSAKATTSIKDFDIIKPISKGAFGSVYLAKKRNTGDYYAIKVLKKADMIAKNQVTNVKAERKIMMTQADSDFAVKLYWTFQSKDYLYLVMEYLNGGDCASLIKVMGCLDEDWAKSYVAEIVLGLEYLHGRGIVHRDLKPDNLLIDSRGHLRLTDFGLSRFGLLGRQARTINQSSAQLSKRLQRRAIPKTFPQTKSELSTPDSQLRASYFGSISLEDPDAMSESSGSESVTDRHKSASRNSESPAISMGSQSGKLLPRVASPNKQSDSHRFVGTVDYVAPESILGVGVGEGVDWWALGVICHEFLTSFPPFHADTPEQVFDNILSRRINWHDDDIEWSPEARDFVDRLLCPDATRRLGAKGAEEVKRHPFLRGIDWTKLREYEGNFVPQTTDPESTDYFDDRGAASQVFQEDSIEADLPPITSETPIVAGSVQEINTGKPSSISGTPADDFGTFNFKNLDVLKQANDDVIRKLRSDSVIPPMVDSKVATAIARNDKSKRNSMTDPRPGQPPSPSTSTTSSVGSGISRPSLPNTPFAVLQAHKRKPSNQHGPRVKTDLTDGDDVAGFSRRSSLPGTMRRSSVGVMDKHSNSEGNWHQRRRTSGYTELTPASSTSSPIAGKANLPVKHTESAIQIASAGAVVQPTEKTVDCLIAEDNPISSKILETILVRLGCLCVVVHNGEEAIRCSMGELAFDVIFMDMLMPILDGENAARMIKSTNNANQNTPIVAVTSYAAHERIHITEEGTLFNAVLTKPVSKADVLNVLTKLGFVTKTKPAPTTGESSAPAHRTNMVRKLPVGDASAI